MTTRSKKLAETIHAIAVQKMSNDKVGPFESHPLLVRLRELGTESWLDTGDLELARSLWKKEMSASTTNNTLANQVVQSGVMDAVIRETADKIRAACGDLSQEEMVREIGFVINCRIALRLVEAFRVRVSVELHPDVARDIDRTVELGHRYYKICPEYFIIKIPLTPEGYLAVRRLRREGVPINFTLGFSARQNYLAARLSNPNYCNVFLGRLNQVVVDNKLGDGRYVGEKVTWATQKALIEARLNPKVITKLIGASIRNGEQVGTLAGVDVLTIPPSAVKEFMASGVTPKALNNNLEHKFEAGVNFWDSRSSRLPLLWELQKVFVDFVDELLLDKRLDSFTGEDLVKFCEARGIDLFRRFSREELKKICDHGKIPRIDDWPSGVAMDDLMTQSALQSFAKDQDALDQRIRSFLK
jgi:transaldolase